MGGLTKKICDLGRVERGRRGEYVFLLVNSAWGANAVLKSRYFTLNCEGHISHNTAQRASLARKGQ